MLKTQKEFHILSSHINDEIMMVTLLKGETGLKNNYMNQH